MTDDIKELIERLRMPTQEFKNLHNEAADALEAQAERIKQLEADAARYSFLRMPSNSKKAEYLLRNNWDKELDDAIDAAMKEQGNETRRMADELESQHAPLPSP